MPTTNKQVLNMVLTSTDRSQISRSWNGHGGNMNDGGDMKTRKLTPFRAVNNAGDILSRKNYTCGGPNQVSNSRRRQTGSMFRGAVRSNCDDSGVEGASGNAKYVYDSSTYSRYKRLAATQKNYTDSSYGGDLNHGSQSTQL